MTISIKVSVNGNYKVPVTIKYGDDPAVTEVISGRGHEGSFVKDILPGRITIVTVGPEEEDKP